MEEYIKKPETSIALFLFFKNPRYTFVEMLIDGMGGSLRLYADGRISVQQLGQQEVDYTYTPSKDGFTGDCLYETQRHFIDVLMNNASPFETSRDEYLRSECAGSSLWVCFG